MLAGCLQNFLTKNERNVASKLRETGTVDRCVGSGRPRSARTEENIDLIDDLIVSQEDKPGFISPDLWPPNSADLSPVDCRIWGLMQERVYKTAVPDVSQLKQRLIETWSSLSQDVIDDAIDQWRLRL